MSHLILQADARRIPLADKSVQMVCTSPPYFNLRSYDTAKWIGGDPDCSHEILRKSRIMRPRGKLVGSLSHIEAAEPVYKDACGRCGAVRQDKQIGLEKTPQDYVKEMVGVFREVKRILRDDGIAWLNISDTFAGGGRGGNPEESNHRKQATNFGSVTGETKNPFPIPIGTKPKDLIGIPWMLAFALRDDGWYLRSAVTWCKRNPMCESVVDRPTRATEQVFLLTKSERYYYDQNACRVPPKATTLARDNYTRITKGKDKQYAVQHNHETPSNPQGRNLWDYWLISSNPYKGSHYAVMPMKLAKRCIQLGTSEKGCCPHCGTCWQRTIQTPKIPDEIRNRGTGSKMDFHTRSLGGGQKIQDWRDQNPSQTTGWRPTCKCPEHAPVPCIVFDPFSGAATSGVAAAALNRHFIGTELSPKYAHMGLRRIERPHAAPPREPTRKENLPLFDFLDQ